MELKQFVDEALASFAKTRHDWWTLDFHRACYYHLFKLLQGCTFLQWWDTSIGHSKNLSEAERVKAIREVFKYYVGLIAADLHLINGVPLSEVAEQTTLIISRVKDTAPDFYNGEPPLLAFEHFCANVILKRHLGIGDFLSFLRVQRLSIEDLLA